MKNAKKVLAMVIVLALAISMAIPASAATLKVQQAHDNIQAAVNYKAWQMATLEYVQMSADPKVEAYAYYATNDWKEFFEDNDDVLFDYEPANNIILEVVEGVTAVQIAAAALEYAKDKTLDADYNADSNVDGLANLGTVADGYVLVTSERGTLLMLDTVGDGDDKGNLIITEKNDKPTLVKKVNDKHADDVAVGDTVKYTIDIEVKKGAFNYYVEDLLPAGITFDTTKGVTTNIAGVTASAAQIGDTNEYKITIENEEDIEIPVVDGKYTSATLTLTYYGIVTSGVAIDGANQNSATLFYGQNGEGNAFESNTDTASVYTWSVKLHKFASGVEFLANAVFEIYDQDPYGTYAVGEEPQPLKFTYVDGKGYVFSGATGDNQFTTNDTAALTFAGLDSEKTYFFKEVAAPDGYNELLDTEDVTITPEDVDLADEVLAVTYSGKTNNQTLKVKNSTGAVLPSTGGTGTVIFVAVGTFLVLAMGVLLVVRKRMSKVVYTR